MGAEGDFGASKLVLSLYCEYPRTRLSRSRDSVNVSGSDKRRRTDDLWTIFADGFVGSIEIYGIGVLFSRLSSSAVAARPSMSGWFSTDSGSALVEWVVSMIEWKSYSSSVSTLPGS